MAGASEPVDVSTKRQRIAELARQSPEMGFTSLAYFIDIDWMHEAFRRTRKAGAATETRPLGIPTFEDKVLQRAVVMVLEAVYEQDFKDCSYGFRPGRSAHQAPESLW